VAPRALHAVWPSFERDTYATMCPQSRRLSLRSPLWDAVTLMIFTIPLRRIARCAVYKCRSDVAASQVGGGEARRRGGATLW